MRHLSSLLILLFSLGFLNAQSEIHFPSTNLYLQLVDDCSLQAADGGCYCDEYSFSTMVMDGVNFHEQHSDFDDIEGDYAAKGAKVISRKDGKLGAYDAIFIHIEGTVSLYQIVFGDSQFLAFFNVVPIQTLDDSLKDKIHTNLSGVSYRVSTESPLVEHALFQVDTSITDFRFVNHSGMFFAFESATSEDALVVMQLPMEMTGIESQEALMGEFESGLKAKGLDFDVLHQGPWATSTLAGIYRFGTTRTAEGKTGYLGLYLSEVANQPLVFQLIFSEAPQVELESSYQLLEGFAPKE